MERKCIICKSKPLYEIRLSLAVHANHPPALTTPVCYVCEDHKDDFTFESLTQKSWKKICKGFLSIGRQAPKKEFSSMIIIPISSDPNLS